MIDLIVKNLPLVLAASGALIVAFLTPFGSKAVERFFARRPAFAVRSPVLDGRLRIVVEPANSLARRRRSLGVSVRGINIPDAGLIAVENQEMQWTVDLAKIDRLLDVLKDGEDYEFQFFFRVDRPSDKVVLRFVADKTENLAPGEPISLNVTSVTDLLSKVQSATRIRCDFSEGIINRAFPFNGRNSKWASVHDGKEVQLFGLSNLEISGARTRILAEPRYAWVLNFFNCRYFALRNLDLGHTESGYCMGGVIRFQSCSDIIIEGCDLFGCGTYGLEFVDCDHVELNDVTVRNCTYGIMNLKNVSDFVARSCRFVDNEGYQLLNFSGSSDDVMFKACTFVDNRSRGSLFHFARKSAPSSIFVNNSSFSGNTYAGFTNGSVSQNHNKFENETRQDRIDP